jgi:uncharacterized membrane protein
MTGRATPRSIDDYLAALRAALAGEDPALLQDALYDAEEHLRAALQAGAAEDPAAAFTGIVEAYGSPEEIATAYRNSERQVHAALEPRAPSRAQTAFERFFGVFADSRAWLSLFFMLLSLVTGVVYFSVTVIGLGVSLGTMILIFGLPLLLLFVGFSRVLALAEGRLIEAMLGTRMPRRPRYVAKPQSFTTRIKSMLTDRRTWTTLVYFVLMLPLGVAYFTVAVTGLATATALLLAPLALIGHQFGWITIEGEIVPLPGPWAAAAACIAGALLWTLLLHIARWTGRLHGAFAKHLLVAPAAVD